MLRWIVETAVRWRVVVVALSLVVVVVGLRALRGMPLDVFPEFAPPRIEVQTEVPGLSALDVESLVTVPLEAALQGTPRLDLVRSKSVEGLSSIEMILEPAADLMEARQLVQERLATVRSRLPAVARPPVLLSPLSATSRVLKVGLVSDTLSRTELSTLATWTVRPRLLAVPGVANVAVWGQRDRELQVLVDPEQLHAHGVTLDGVVEAAAGATRISAGGFVETPNQRISVRHAQHVLGAEELAATALPRPGSSGLRLGDVARVEEGSPPPIGDAVVDDRPGILLIVEKEPWGNTLDVTRGVERALEALAPALGGVRVDSTIFRPATFIETALRNLRTALLVGCVLVVLVLMAFLFEWRTALVSSLAIPLSLVVAVLILVWRGLTVDTMVLAGLVIALGEVVDDAIIDVENVVRRLRLNRAEGSPRSALRVVVEASLEVRSAVVYGTVVVVLVVVPVFFLPGLAGAFFRPLAMAYVLAVGASLLVALTVTPALCYWLLPKAARARPSPLSVWLGSRYERVLPRLLARPRGLLGLVLIGTAVAAWGATRLGEEFLPHFRERDFLMHWVEKPGTSLPAMMRVTERASRELRSIPGVRNFGAHVGRAEVADEVVGIHFTELWVSVDPDVDYEETLARIQEVVDGYPGLYRDVLTYLRERIKEVLTGSSATVVVRIYGPELEGLRRGARAVESALAGVGGVVDLKVEPQELVPRLDVRLRPEALALHGLTPDGVRRATSLLVHGERVGEVYDRQAVFGVRVWSEPALRGDPFALREVGIDTPAGGLVPLGELADVSIEPTPSSIRRENASRRIDVTCNVRGRDLGAVAREVDERLATVDLGPGYHGEVLGEFAARKDAQRRLLGLAALSLVGIVLLLHQDFGSLRLAFLVLCALPFALIGGVVGAWLGGGVLSLGSLIGFVTVFGVAARNAILMVSHFRHLELEEGVPAGRDLVLRGARERLAPVLMTALTAGLALLPLVVAGDRPGHEIEHPLAVVVLGGLTTSTLLTLAVLPALYLAFGRPPRRAVDAVARVRAR